MGALRGVIDPCVYINATGVYFGFPRVDFDQVATALAPMALWHCPVLSVADAKMFVAQADAGDFLLVGEGNLSFTEE